MVWGCLLVDNEGEGERSYISDPPRKACQTCLEKINISVSVVYHGLRSGFTQGVDVQKLFFFLIGKIKIIAYEAKPREPQF